MFASASAPRMPGYQISIAALTLSIHGIATGPPVSSTTMVCGLAAATALTSLSWSIVAGLSPGVWSAGRLSVGESLPSLVGWLTKTMATSEALASAAAVAGSAPSLYSTFAPGAFARIAFSGDEGNQTAGPPYRLGPPPGGSTCADPPPESTPVSACDPISAMDLTSAALSGSWPPAFFSSTDACSAISWAVSAPLNGSTTRPRGGSSTIPAANSVRRMRCTMSSRRAIGTSPLSTAFFSASPKKRLPGSSLSRPASAALTVQWVPPQSEITKPLKPQAFFSTSFSR